MAKRRPEGPLCHLLDRTLSWACWGRGSALLGLRDKEAILGHPLAGQTWETLVVETLVPAITCRGSARAAVQRIL
jgi:hypothetical protein